MTPVPVPPAPDGPPQPARALHELLRELADAAELSGNPYRHARVHADSLRAWADEIERLEAANDDRPLVIQGKDRVIINSMRSRRDMSKSDIEHVLNSSAHYLAEFIETALRVIDSHAHEYR